jgi:hypothetical protein
MMAWVKTSDPSANRAIVSKYRGTNPSWVQRVWPYSNTGEAGFGVETELGTSVTYGKLQSRTNIADNRFHLIAGTYDGSAVKLYVDGVLETSRPLSGRIKDSVYNAVIGNFDLQLDQAASLDGLIDEVKIYSRALSSTEI